MKYSIYIALFLSTLTFTSCSSNEDVDQDNEQQTEIDQNSDEPKTALNFDERTIKEIHAKLGIPKDEKYNYKIYKAHLNADEQEDAIITVNRLDFAINNAATSSNPGKRAELGFIGNNNYFIYYDGQKDQFSVPIMIGSSTKSELGILFENIQSNAYKDLIVEYRIKNAKYRNYYFLQGENLQMVLQWNVFDGLGTSKPKANYFEFAKGSLSSAKDIIIYDGAIKSYDKDVADIYAYKPEIIKGNNFIRRFIYDPAQRAYITPN